MNCANNLLLLFRLYANQPRELGRLIFDRATTENRIDEDRLQVLLDDHRRAERVDVSLHREVDRDLKWLEHPEHHLIAIQDADYPESLKAIYDPPILLFAWGNREALQRNSTRIAMVGARKASAYGLHQAHSLAQNLARESVTIVSGLALGIDAASHEGALAAPGTTLAVLGSGCDQIYPRRHWRLAERITQSGLLLSEFPLRHPVYPANFPRRNRIVTGLCEATLVIEAALKSGSLISARLALSEGREVMAMPGQVNQPQARGCHQLIKEGAQLIEQAEDVLLALGYEMATTSPVESLPLTSEQQSLLVCFERGPLTVDELLVLTAMSVESLSVNLVTLEVMGLLLSSAGRYQRR